MKVTSFIPPAVALALVGVWTTYQRQSISAEEGATASLQKQILAARSSGPATDPPRAKSSDAASAAKDKAPLDWKKALTQLAETARNGGSSDQREKDRLGECLKSMSKEELVAAFDDIAALGLSGKSRLTLEHSLMQLLMAKDPELALTCYADRLHTDFCGGTWSLCNALQGWAEKDPAKATAWLDREIAAGKFDSKSLDGETSDRNWAEGALIEILLGTDPDFAARRLAAIPAELRAEVIEKGMMRDRGEDRVALATLIRSQVPEKDQAKLLAKQMVYLVGGDGYAKVNEYMDRISATPTERMACIEEATQIKIRKISQQVEVTREDLDTMRQWAMTQAPGSIDSITGKALAETLSTGSKAKFDAASAWVLRFHEASGNDDVITSFLDRGSFSNNNQEARALAEKITDPKRRAEILKKFQ
jgi:hypothetical protein